MFHHLVFEIYNTMFNTFIFHQIMKAISPNPLESNSEAVSPHIVLILQQEYHRQNQGYFLLGEVIRLHIMVIIFVSYCVVTHIQRHFSESITVNECYLQNITFTFNVHHCCMSHAMCTMFQCIYQPVYIIVSSFNI